MTESSDIRVTTKDLVTTVEITRPPHNFFDYSLIKQIAEPGDIVVFLGAGSITGWAYALPKELEKLGLGREDGAA